QAFSGNPVLYGGTLAMSPNDPRILYFGTGEADEASDSFYGTGVYKSTDSGRTWRLLTGNGGSNPLYRPARTQIVVDPENASRIYVATSDRVVDSPNQSAVPGVYRFNPNGGGSWTNLTAIKSTLRRPGATSVTGTLSPPDTPGPDDDWRFTFPQK